MDLAIIPSAQVDATVLRASLDAIISIDAHGIVLEFNPAAERMFGYSRAEAIGAEMAGLIVPPPMREAHRSGLRRLLQGGAPRVLDQRVELIAQRADGTVFPIEIAITRMSGSRATYTGFIRDITDHKLVEQERAERLARQALVVALGQSALAGLDPSDLSASALATLVEGLGVDCGSALTVEADGVLRRVSAIGLGPLDGHGEPAGEAHAMMLRRTVAAGGSLLLRGEEVIAAAAEGMRVAAGMGSMLTASLHGDRGATVGMLAVAALDPNALRPVDEGFAKSIANVVGTAIARWRADAEVVRRGLLDPLTGLANRPLFENRLQQALDRGRRDQGDAAVLFVDVDGFGKLNDGFGYRTGDEVLVGVGSRLAGVLPDDATAGRLAGDDFAVLVPGVTSEAEALALAERIGGALREPMLAGGRELTLTASIGVVLTEGGTGSVSEVLRAATVAAKRARERGGARAELATQGMRRRLLHAAEIEQGLRRALTDGELRLHYQPIVDLSGARIAAVEAFVRWQHPRHGLLAPAQFVDAAEATGLAVPLGVEILSLACAEMAAWGRALHDDEPVLPSVHVNVSARHFAAPGLAASVSQALRRSGLPPDKLVLEIAEPMIAGEGQVAMEQLDDLRRVGVRIALDRFGTGYSSLAAIRELPFDALKVDSSFLTELGAGSRDARLIEAMIGIGHSLGLPMTAAKVETEQQLRLLRSLGIDRAQGELFAPPLAGDAALELVRDGSVWSKLLDATKPAAAAARVAAAGAAAADGARAAASLAPEATLSLGQAAQALRISTTTARRWADEGRLGTTRTAGGHRRFSAADVRRVLAERGHATITPAEPPRRPLPALADLVEQHGAALTELSWRGLYGDLRSGFFLEREGMAAAERWTGALSSAAATANYKMLYEATSALMRAARLAGTSLLERHLALERFGETAARALARRSCPREEVVAVRRLFASLCQQQLADLD